MRRFCSLLALMALSSSAHADSFSFVVAGHYIHIEAPRHCRSASCVSVSIPGLLHSKRWRDRDDEVAAAPQPQPQPGPANPPLRAVAPVAGIAAPASPSPVQPVASAPPSPPPPAPAPQLTGTTAKIVVLPPPPPSPSTPPPAAPATTAPQTVAPRPPTKIEPVKTSQAEPLASVVPKPASVPLPVPVPAPVPQIAEVSQKTGDEGADTPLGDWQTEGNKGTVRIERCGQAMCGYLLNANSNAKNDIKNDVKDDLKRDSKGDTILINMKPKSDRVWSGNIYSRSSGHTYYAAMTMKGADTLRVEACGLGHFFCSGNDWTRIENDSKLVTYQPTSRPPS